MVSKVQMILATGNSAERVSCRSGFSLIEIVLVLGLAALAATAMIVNFVSLVDRENNLTTNEMLFAAVRKARFIAASERTITQLRFDKDENRLQILSENSEVDSFELNETFKENRSAEIRFYLISASRGLAPAENPERANLETKRVEFAPDRSASPFVAEIDLGSGTPERLHFDPFSSLQITSR